MRSQQLAQNEVEDVRWEVERDGDGRAKPESGLELGDLAPQTRNLAVLFREGGPQAQNFAFRFARATRRHWSRR